MKAQKSIPKKPMTKMKIVKKRKMPKSSSSNPVTKKFREAVKQSFHGKHFPFGYNPSSSYQTKSQAQLQSKAIQLPGGSLTLEALEKHNASTGGFTEASIQDDATSFGGTTFNTWATNLTGCTNVTFNKVHRYINSNSIVQKEILAVLAAITEVIKENGGEGSDVQYFGLLVTSLEKPDKLETRLAMAHLLSIVIKRVPVSVLQSRFSQVQKTLMGLVTDCVKQQMTTPLKPALSCLASLLRVQGLDKWLDGSIKHTFDALLAFVSHKKPKIRKAAHTAVKIVLKGSIFMQQTPAPPFHPAASTIARCCERQIEAYRGQSNKEVMYTLSLLKDTLSLFPATNVKSLCEMLLRLMTLTDLILRSSCIEVLFRLFSAKPSVEIMPAQMNAQLLTALYEYQPSVKDSQPMIAWLKVMEAANVNLANQNIDLNVNHLPRLFSTCMTCLLSDRHDVAKAAVDTMKVLLLECVEAVKEKLVSNASIAVLQKVVKTLETGLSYQFHSNWSLVLQLWSTAFQSSVTRNFFNPFITCLSSMGDLRDTPHFSFKGEMDQAIGFAVKNMGPRLVLESIPLGITGENDNLDFPRGWLLPVLRDNIGHTELSFFSSYFLPLAAKFRTKAESFTKEGRIAEGKAYDALHLQLWSLLKAFCDHPTDLKQSFQGIAKILGTALSEREDLRMDVMAALRSLISCSLENESDKEEVGRFAKNFLPILFNQFTGEGILSDGVRLAVLETIKKYLVVADLKLILTFLDKCLDKLQELDYSGFRNIALLDLAISMVPFADLKRVKLLFDLSLQRLQSEDRTIQKKSYRVLEEICRSQSPSCQELISTHLDEIRDSLLQSLSNSSPSSKAPRLRCLIHVYKNLQQCNMDFFMATLPEAILCTKEIGARARAAAFELVIVMADSFITWNSEATEKECLGVFVNKVLAGLAGSPHMISATLLALTRMVFVYKERLIGPVLDNLIDSACLLLASKTREVIKAALGFIKVLISAYENTILASHLKDLLKSLHEIALKGNVRRPTKIIFTKLIKKFGFELILSMTRTEVHKLLKNIHKSTERAKRKQNEGDEPGDEDEGDSDEEEKIAVQPESIDDLLQDTDSEIGDDEESESLPKKNKKRKHGKDAWLMETGEDEIVDFMDPAAAKQVIATRPNNTREEKKTVDKDRGFKMSSDGKLIITQEDEEKGPKGKKSAAEKDEDDDLEDLVSAVAEEFKKKSRKRKLDSAIGGDDGENEPPASKYQAGGSGIHRQVAQAKRSIKEKTEIGQEYKAKKASGDIKKKGRPDPYAYVPLNFNALNKRKQMKIKGSFNNLVKGAKRGAVKGVKSKVQRSRR
ncbi:unnamed protein product [Lymnaea stagnalis]|uniref:RRP12-like protein n=1 Tax=Lymnaea stagnalis TaxID=6523 RepID=A0AAV2HZA0_LYMST